jgi:hypothetical protein
MFNLLRFVNCDNTLFSRRLHGIDKCVKLVSDEAKLSTFVDMYGVLIVNFVKFDHNVQSMPSAVHVMHGSIFLQVRHSCAHVWLFFFKYSHAGRRCGVLLEKYLSIFVG